MTLRCFSYGGGVQSTAALVLAVQGKIDFPIFLFSNVGDDSEHPATLAYVENVAKPYAEKNGIELIELRRQIKRGERAGQTESLYGRLQRDARSIAIPMRMSGSGAPGTRQCTVDFKVRVIASWVRGRGATPEQRAVVGLGISVDEYQRMSTDRDGEPMTKTYPLIDLRLTRQDCINIIERAGLPIPPKSSCWFCPFHSLTRWREMKEREPELFARAVTLEHQMNERRATLGKDQVWLARTLRPLDQSVQGEQRMMDFDDACESGFCMT